MVGQHNALIEPQSKHGGDDDWWRVYTTHGRMTRTPGRQVDDNITYPSLRAGEQRNYCISKLSTRMGLKSLSNSFII